MSDVAFGNLRLATCSCLGSGSTDGRCTSSPPCTSPSGLPSSLHPLGGTCEGRSTSCWASLVPLGCRSGPEGSPCSSSGTRSCRPRRPTECPQPCWGGRLHQRKPQHSKDFRSKPSTLQREKPGLGVDVHLDDASLDGIADILQGRA